MYKPAPLARRLLALAVAITWTGLPASAAERLSEPAQWLRDYLAIDTTNPPGGEHRAAAYLGYLLRQERIASELILTPDGRVNLVARLKAEHPTGGPLLLTHHMDVVPAGPGWTVPPFAGEVRGGALWGRGAIDTKGLGIAHLAAMIDLKRRGVALSRDVIFLAVADEETGGAEGMAWLVEHRPDLFEGVAAALNEGGASRGNERRLLWWEVEVAQKRPLWLRLTVSGRGGHASAYSPESPAHLLIQGLGRLLALPPDYRVSAAARDYFHAIAPLHQNANLRRTYSEIDQVIARDGAKAPLLPGLHKLLLDTVQVTVLKASESINVIAPEASAEVDVRLLPDTDADAFLAKVREALGRDVEVEVLLTAPVAAPSPTGNGIWQAIARGLGSGPRGGSIVPALAAGFTDSRHFRQRGVPAYGVMPFELNAEDAAGIHAADEHLALAELERGVARMRLIVAIFAAR